MSQQLLTVRQEHLQNLAPFCRCLVDALQGTGLPPDEVLGALHDTVTAECVQCGIQVSGEELSALAQPPSPEHASAKIGRLRLGDCARKGCDSCYYRLSFQAHPKVDWPSLLSQIEVIPQNQVEQPSAASAWKLAGGLRVLRSVPRRAWIALAVVLVLLVVRQWYSGGRLPLIREPENFKIQPAPEAELPDGSEGAQPGD